MVVVHDSIFRIAQVLCAYIPDDAHVYELPVVTNQVVGGTFLQNKQSKEIDQSDFLFVLGNFAERYEFVESLGIDLSYIKAL